MVNTVQPKIINGLPGLTIRSHKVLGFEAIMQVEFFGNGDFPAKMKQVLLIPGDLPAPNHLRTENVITYRVPEDFRLETIEMINDLLDGRALVMAKLHYRTGDELHCHDHILVG